MPKLHIITDENNKILRSKAKPVKKITPQIQKLLEDMTETMEYANGIGLAAPQIGESLRLIVAKFNHDTAEEMNVPMINPEIIYRSPELELGDEGCLSVPGIFDQVVRSKEIIVRYLNPKGQENLLKLNNLNARIIQHELDHLEGILFIDKIVEDIENTRKKLNQKENLSL